jgi:hypothetical protein
MTNTLPATPGDGVDAFLKAHGAPIGEFIRFTKEATFAKSDGEVIPIGSKHICVFDQTQHGWIKFNGEGNPPTREMGPMFGGHVPLPRRELGDDDQALWKPGLDGKPADPWRFQVLLPLKELEGDRLFIFETKSASGLRAAASLISTCKQEAKRYPDMYPVIELAVGAFKARNGITVKKPSFKVVGRAPRNGMGQVQIGTSADLDDEIPF